MISTVVLCRTSRRERKKKNNQSFKKKNPKNQNLKETAEIQNNFFEMFPRHNILRKAKAQEGLETKHHEFAFEHFTEGIKGHDHNLHVELHPKENLHFFFLLHLGTECFYAT